MIQVSIEKKGKRTIDLSQINAFLKIMSGVTISQIEYKYCPLPQLASNASVAFARGVPEEKKFKWSVFKFPPSYSD